MQKNATKRAQIIEAAAICFHKYGYAKTSLDDIGREAGMGKGSLYYYFESKEDLFLEVARGHAESFYGLLKGLIDREDDFAQKISIAIKYPIKLIYEHAPILLEAINSLPLNYLQKMDEFRQENKKKMLELLEEVISRGIAADAITPAIPSDKIVNIIYDWFLMGDSNIIIKYPEEFIKKAETDYDWLIQILLYGIIKRGE